METTVQIRQRDAHAYIPVPVQFLQNLAIKPGDSVSLYLEGDTITLSPRLEPAVELETILKACTDSVLERDMDNRKWCYMSLKGREC